MKKHLLVLCAGLYGINAYGAGVVLSDTSVSDSDVMAEESFVAPQSANRYSESNSFISQQIKPAAKSVLANDTSDPLFMVGDDMFLSDTYVSHLDSRLRVGENISYGINNHFSIYANMHYQVDFSGNREHGFSATEIGGVYRMSDGTGTSRIISDVLFGLKAWGSAHVRTPEYADSSYFAGLRFGRQYAGATLSGTIKSTWVFDDERGLSYIDFIPEAYFRFIYDWRAGIGFDLRKSTSPRLLENKDWLNLKLLRQYGNTQYVGNAGFEIGTGEVQLGFNIKILF